MSISRRDIFTKVVLSSAAVTLSAASRAQSKRPMPMNMDMDEPKPARPRVPRLPAILCRTAETINIDAAYRQLEGGADTLDAVLTLTQGQEDNPDDFTCGLGGLPNQDGVVQLDACCFHGPSRRSAAVGSVTGIRHASALARAVMETGYSSFVGADAERLASSKGFAVERLTTDLTTRMWHLWRDARATLKPSGPLTYDPTWSGPDRDAHFLPASQQALDRLVNQLADQAKSAGIGPQWTWRAAYEALFPVSAPLYVSAVNAKNEMSAAATTSGLPWRMAGAVSDVAMLGTGCYLDPAVGSAGASGNAGANAKIAGAYAIVDNMKKGMSPADAGMDALRRLADWYRHDMASLRFVEIIYYVLRRDGAYACVSLWHGNRVGQVQTYEIHDGHRRSEECLFLFDGSPLIGV